MVRKLVRESRLLCKPKEDRPFLSLDGKLLHPKLVNMYFTASNNCQTYLKNIEKDIDFELHPIFATVEDEIECYNGNNWTIPMIKK